MLINSGDSRALKHMNLKAMFCRIFNYIPRAITSAGGNGTVLAKSFIVAVEGRHIGLVLLAQAKICILFENLRHKIVANFQGFAK